MQQIDASLAVVVARTEIVVSSATRMVPYANRRCIAAGDEAPVTRLRMSTADHTVPSANAMLKSVRLP